MPELVSRRVSSIHKNTSRTHMSPEMDNMIQAISEKGVKEAHGPLQCPNREAWYLLHTDTADVLAEL